MKFLKCIFQLSALLLLTNCSNNNSADYQDKDSITSDTAIINEFTNLLRAMYKWDVFKADKSRDFIELSKDSFFTGVDTVALANKLDELKQSNFFTKDFLDNYKNMALQIDMQIKSDTIKYPIGELPPWDPNADRWCNCQESPDNYWDSLIVKDVKMYPDSASLNWTWSAFTTDTNFLYHVKLQRHNGVWKISYLEGFDIQKLPE